MVLLHAAGAAFAAAEFPSLNLSTNAIQRAERSSARVDFRGNKTRVGSYLNSSQQSAVQFVTDDDDDDNIIQ